MRQTGGIFGRIGSGALAALGMTALLGVSAPAQAGDTSATLTVTFSQVGADVVGSFSGNFYLPGAAYKGTQAASSLIYSNVGYIVLGAQITPALSYGLPIYQMDPFSSLPAAFTPSTFAYANSASGSPFALNIRYRKSFSQSATPACRKFPAGRSGTTPHWRRSA